MSWDFGDRREWLDIDELVMVEETTVLVEFMCGDVDFGYLGMNDGKFIPDEGGEAHMLVDALAERAGTSSSPEFVVELLKLKHLGVRIERMAPNRFLVHVPIEKRKKRAFFAQHGRRHGD